MTAAAKQTQGDGKKYLVVAVTKRGVNSPFRRSVRDAKGKVVETMIFPRGEPVELNQDQFDAIQADIEKGAIKAFDPDKPNTPAAIRERIAQEQQDEQDKLDEERRAADRREAEYQRESGLPI